MGGCWDTPEIRRLQEKNFYNGTFLLHSHGHKHCKMPSGESHPIRNIATAIEDISKILIREKIPACLSKIGAKYNDSPDFSKVVYYNTPKL